MSLSDLFAKRIAGSVAAVESLRDQISEIALVAQMIVNRLADGGAVYTAGNGGSAAHALHFAEELVGRYRSNRKPLRAICLNADPTALTCIANDFGFEEVFARQCEALIQPGDVLVAFSTSGSSPNLVQALRMARTKGATCVGVLGSDGGQCKGLCDHAIVVSAGSHGRDTAHIQEAHQVVVHLFCEAAEAPLPGSPAAAL